MKESSKLIIQLSMIAILITINILIIVNGINLDCDKCYIKIKQTNNDFEFNISMTQIYNNYLNDTCYIYNVNK